MCITMLGSVMMFSNYASKVDLWSCYSIVDTFQDPFSLNSTNQGLSYHKVCYKNNETPMQVLCYSCLYRGQTYMTKIQLNTTQVITK